MQRDWRKERRRGRRDIALGILFALGGCVMALILSAGHPSFPIIMEYSLVGYAGLIEGSAFYAHSKEYSSLMGACCGAFLLSPDGGKLLPDRYRGGGEATRWRANWVAGSPARGIMVVAGAPAPDAQGAVKGAECSDEAVCGA